MKYLYSLAVFHEPENEEFDRAYSVIVYDLNLEYELSSNSMSDLISSTKGCIEEELALMASRGVIPPKPTSSNVAYHNPDYEDAIWVMIEIDVDPYFGKSSKINITLPDSVIKEIDTLTDGREPEYKNRSQFIRRCVLKEIESYRSATGEERED